LSRKLVEVVRGNIVESVHRGSVAVARGDGTVLYKLGDIDRVFFLRSSAKPLQGLAALEAGIAEAYNLDLKEIAICLSSHLGEKEHIDVLESLLKKTGIEEDQLDCGAHNPLGEKAYRELVSSGQKVRNLHCNCSGKHIAILAACNLKGIPFDEYTSFHHPFQKDIISIITQFAKVDLSRMAKGMDGCSLPVYGIPLKNMAVAYANLTNEKFQNGRFAKSQNYIISAMTMHPEMVAGEGKIDTELMKYFGDRLICKSGSEALICAGLPGKDMGIAIKIEDGNPRAVGPAIIEVLLQLKIIGPELPEALQKLWKPVLKTHNGKESGEVKATFRL